MWQSKKKAQFHLAIQSFTFVFFVRFGNICHSASELLILLNDTSTRYHKALIYRVKATQSDN